MVFNDTLLRGFIEYEQDKLTRESLQKIFRHHPFDQSKNYVCNDSGKVVSMVNDTGQLSLTIDYLGSDPDRFAKLLKENTVKNIYNY